MPNSLYMATTYLKFFLQAHKELTEVVSKISDHDIDDLLEADYIQGEVIQDILSYIANQGADSWLLRYSQNLSVVTHGPLGLAVLSSPDLHTALTVLAGFTEVRSSFYSSELIYKGNRVELKLTDNTQHPVTGQWLLEMGVSVAQNLIEVITAHPLGDNALISFSCAPPPYAGELETFFGAPCRFNAPYTAISIPSSWGRITSPLYDEVMFRNNLAKCQELKLKLSGPGNLIDSVRLRINHFFDQRLAGKATAKQLPSLQSLADEQFMSTRTLARKLKQQNSSYKKILEEVRCDYAVNLLSRTHQTIAEIAYHLAYQEPANFNRAFKTWFNMTPSAWRQSKKKTDMKRLK